MPMVLVRYAGDPPRSSDLLDRLGVERDPDAYSVFTASQTLERVWRDLLDQDRDRAPAHQRGPNGKLQILFHKAVRHFLDRQILTPAEERVALQRAAQAVAADPGQARQLKHDVFAWRDALAQVGSRGIDLSAGPHPDLDSVLVHSAVGQLLCGLQKKYRELQAEGGRHSFEEAAAEYLQERYRPTRHVLLEGFTHFHPLHALLLDACTRHGATVYLLYPWRPEQAPGFAVMDRAYERFGTASVIDLPTTWSPRRGDVTVLQRSLFALAQGETAPGDGSVTLEAYTHRHQEVAACVRRIQQYLRSGYQTRDIAVITRESYEFLALLQEEAELQRLVDGEGKTAVLATPARLLLLTPLGRFVLALYEVWRDDALHLTPDHFEAILASGWLGAHAQATTDHFTTARGQVFARCRIRGEWDEGLARLGDLRAALPPDSRLPVAAIADEHLRLWGEAVAQVERLCRKLFGGDNRSIGQHIRLLLDELSQLAPDEMRTREREVLERIREALLQVAESTSLPMSSREFGEVLNGLVQEYAREQDEDDDNRPNLIWCNTPPGIDGYERKIVFFLGLDNRRVPQRYPEPWPFYTHTIDAHQETERYLFLAVARAARDHLHLSYAQADDRDIYRPSSYLEQAATVLGCRINTVVGAAESAGPAVPPDRPSPLPARRPLYTLAEIAHFGLCPFRYKLETLDPGARTYRDANDAFQLGPLAVACWVDMTCRHLAAERRQATGEAAVRAMFEDGLETTRPAAAAAFPGLRKLEWFTVRRYARRDLDRAGQNANGYPVRVIPGTPGRYVIPDGDRTVQVDVPVRHAILKGAFPYPFVTDLLREEWLLPGREPKETERAFGEAGGVRVFASHYHAVRWWRRATTTAFFYAASRGRRGDFADKQQGEYARVQDEIRGWLPLIEAGDYPKNPGDHCAYCPVRGECLGL